MHVWQWVHLRGIITKGCFLLFACESASHQNHGATDASEQGKQNHGATEQGGDRTEQNRGEAEHKVNGGKGARSTMFGPLPRTGATDNHLYKSNAFNRTGQQPVVMR